MPQLTSGRHVALGASPYLHPLSAEKDESRYFAAVALRPHAGTPAHRQTGRPVRSPGDRQLR